MPRRIDLEPHLSIDELENRYRQSKDAIAKRRPVGSPALITKLFGY